MLARKYGLVTDFGKLMDPLADKILVASALITFLELDTMPCVIVIIVIFREFAVTSLRLVVAGKSGIVVAAAWLGKVKTCVQILCILTMIIEPMFNYDFLGGHVASYVTMAAMSVLTIWSGVVYFKAYWKYINPSV